jgi:hypothetical protein
MPKKATAAAQKIEGTFGNSAQARNYERRIIEQLQAWGIPDGDDPAKYIKYGHTEESRLPNGIPIPVSCQLCGHPIIYKQVCWQTGPGDIFRERVLGCDCLGNYAIVNPSQARLAELKTAELQKEFQKKQKEARAAERKVTYVERFKDVLDYIKAFKALNGENAFLPHPLFEARRAIESGEHGEKKMGGIIEFARRHMLDNPIGKLAEAKETADAEIQRLQAERKAAEAAQLAERKAKFGTHMEFIQQKAAEDPGNEFWASMRQKFGRYLSDVTGWIPTEGMIAAVEKQMKRSQPQDEASNVNKWQGVISRVEAIAHIKWSEKKGFNPSLGQWMPSQAEKFAMLDDIMGRLVQYGEFASDKQEATFFKTLEQMEQWAKGKEERRK